MLFFHKAKYTIRDIGLKSDIHCHIVPGVDDGARTPEDHAKMLQAMKEAGIERMIATPHVCKSLYPNYASDLRAVYKDTLLAAEYMVDDDFREMSSDPLLYPDRKHILIEMSYFERSRNILDEIFRLREMGLCPILAHPERYRFYQESPAGMAELEKIVDMGCQLQLNVMSLTGVYGPGSKTILRNLLTHGMYSYIATDLHSARQLEMMNRFYVKESWLDLLHSLCLSNEALFFLPDSVSEPSP